MPSPGVDTPCSLLVLSCWLETAGLTQSEAGGQGGLEAPCPEAATASRAQHRPTPLVGSSPFWRERGRRS